jgi:hypothetical protein
LPAPAGGAGWNGDGPLGGGVPPKTVEAWAALFDAAGPGCGKLAAGAGWNGAGAGAGGWNGAGGCIASAVAAVPTACAGDGDGDGDGPGPGADRPACFSRSAAE